MFSHTNTLSHQLCAAGYYVPVGHIQTIYVHYYVPVGHIQAMAIFFNQIFNIRIEFFIGLEVNW